MRRIYSTLHNLSLVAVDVGLDHIYKRKDDSFFLVILDVDLVTL